MVMQRLTLIEVLKNVFGTLVNSEVFSLLVFEAAILLVALVFSKLMDKKKVIKTSIFASLIVAVFYLSNYFSTVVTFVNNVSTRLVEMIYFPTTLEFVVVMIISFIIMITTLLSKKTSKVLKVINSILPISISFILFTIIEVINTNNIAFDEFSVFTDPVLTSLYQMGMGLFITWLLGLIIYKIDMFIINRVSLNKEVEETKPLEDTKLVTVKLPKDYEVKESDLEDDFIELPRLKGEVKGM
jgi:hypothetical protein